MVGAVAVEDLTDLRATVMISGPHQARSPGHYGGMTQPPAPAAVTVTFAGSGDAFGSLRDRIWRHIRKSA